MEITIEKYDGTGGPIPCHYAYQDKCAKFSEWHIHGFWVASWACEDHKGKRVAELQAEVESQLNAA